MNFLDLVIIGLLLLGGLNGYRKGLIKSLVGITSSFIAALVAIATYKTFTPVLHSKLGVGKLIADLTNRSLTQPAANIQPLRGNGLNQVSLNASLLPQFLRNEFDSMFVNFMNTTVGKSVHSVQDAVLQYFTLVIVSMLAFLLVFIVTNWLLRIAGTVLTKSVERSFIGSLNHSGGFIIGLLGATLMLSIMLAFVLPLFMLYPVSTVTGLLDHSVLMPYVVRVFSGLASAITHS